MRLAIDRAIRFAEVAHSGQTRKFTLEPYVNHCIRVGLILFANGEDETTVVSGILHDVVEDTRFCLSDIDLIFGEAVAETVWFVTDQSTPADGNRKTRKQIDLEHISIGTYRSKTVKIADLIDNTYDIVRHDPNFAPTYLREKADLLNLALIEGNKRLWAMALRQLTWI